MATGDKLVNLDVLKNTVQKEVVDLKSAFSEETDNLFYFPLGIDTTINGVYITQEKDGTVLLNGTASGNTNIPICGKANATADTVLPAGTYTFGLWVVSGTVSSAGNSAFGIRAGDTTTIALAQGKRINTMTFASDAICYLRLGSGITYSNFRFRVKIISGTELGDYYPHFTGYDYVARQMISDYRSEIPEIEQYLFATDSYIGNGAIARTTGWNLYKIPFTNKMIFVSWDNNNKFWMPEMSFGDAYVFVLVDSSGNYVQVDPAVTTEPGRYFSPSAHEYALFAECGGAYTHLIVCCHKTKTDTVKLNLFDGHSGITDESGMTRADLYINRSDYRIAALGTGAHGYLMQMYPNDAMRKRDNASALSYNYTYYGEALKNSTALEYIPTETGVIFVFDNADDENAIYTPFEARKQPETSLLNRRGVAFGTSLTAYASNSDGYLDYLPDLCDVIFDNQGLANGQILPNVSYPDILGQIKSYTGYTSLAICILEGFVNDWARNGESLGNWNDTGETTVCGCVRSAINYIYAQNPYITLFLVLDHYGKSGSVDCQSTATNSAGKTQYEFYEEIAKVAESLGVPVIKEYADSSISENAPQYLKDNIHLNARGAKQSAFTIWAGMKQHFAMTVS